MSLLVDIPPMKALKLFYGGESLGVSKIDIAKYNKHHDVGLPPVVERFLLNYAYFNVNRGEAQLWHPLKIKSVTASIDEKPAPTKDFLLIGESNGVPIGVEVNDADQQNPKLWILFEDNDRKWHYIDDDLDLDNFLKIMLLKSPVVFNNSKVCSDHDGIVKILATVGSSKLKNLFSADLRPRQIVCWDQKEHEFLALMMRQNSEALIKFPSILTMDDLEGLFVKEFYDNYEHCDYRHALRLLTEIIERLETTHGKNMLNLAEKYQLAGRCCWALKEWKRADEWYAKAKQIFTNELSLTLDKVQAFYESMGNYYLAREDVLKSQAAYVEVDRLCNFLGKNGAINRGNRVMRQAQIFIEYEQFDKAIDLYEQALKIYHEDAKGCKYEIARCQQLCGEARKKLKQNQNKTKQ